MTCFASPSMQCAVRSYLQWLQDSDFESVCALCRKPLAQGDVVRLPCLGTTYAGPCDDDDDDDYGDDSYSYSYSSYSSASSC